MFAAFAELGVEAEPVVYSDEAVAAARAQLLRLDGVLVWVNPIEHGRDRALLDHLLRDVAAAGTFVSAHPDVILKIATKRILADTAHMSWSAGAHLYASHEQLATELPTRLAEQRTIVLKQYRGMGGAGVWKVAIELDGANDVDRSVLVQHAEQASAAEMMPLGEFIARCESYFDDGGLMVDQPFQPRLKEGMIRVYLCHDQVVGFAHQHPRGLLPPDEAEGLRREKVFLSAEEPAYRRLRSQLETEWLPELQQLADVKTADLPLIWDTDFLLGPTDAGGQDTYVLCEINASSTFAFPEHAMPTVARATLEQIRR